MKIIKAMGTNSFFISLIIVVAMCIAISKANATNLANPTPAINKYLMETMFGRECSFTVYQTADPFATNDGASLSFGWKDNLCLPPVILKAKQLCPEIIIRLVPLPFQFRHIQKNNFAKRTEIPSSGYEVFWDWNDFKQVKEEGYGSCFKNLDFACFFKTYQKNKLLE